MKILQLGKFYPVKGGVEQVMVNLLHGLSAKNIPGTMLCASSNRKSCEIIWNDKIRIICTSTWVQLFATMLSPMMVIKLRKIKTLYDVIHIHHPDPMAALALWLSGYKGKVVLHWHSDILKQRMMMKLYSPLQDWLIRRADVVIGTTPKYINESPFLQSSSLHKMSIPIGIDPVVPDAEKVQAIRRRYKGKKIIFSLGRLVAYKGFAYLIKAATYLSDEYVMLIGGNGPLFEELNDLIVSFGVENRVKLLGRLAEEDLPDYYGACDVYVLSSIWKTEAFGIVQIEAMSCGKPIIATKIKGSGVSWVNKDGVSGINVEPANPKMMADAIIYILSDKVRYEKFSQAAKIRYQTLFKKEMMIDKCVELYKTLL